MRPEPPADRPVALIVGAGGLLGRAVSGVCTSAGREVVTVPVRWSSPADAVDSLIRATSAISDRGEPWQLYWCAGAGVVGTEEADLEAEVQTFAQFLKKLLLMAPSLNRRPSAIFVASSAGGVYAGSIGADHDELTEPHPISAYGHAKLAAEAQMQEFTACSAIPSFVGRFANLYGPGQNPAKAQGLISTLCRNHLTHRPTRIFVPLDTVRDYVFVRDAAKVVVAGTDRCALGPDRVMTIKIIASQQASTIAAILSELRRITKHRPLVVASTSPVARFQAPRLRFRSIVWPELDELVGTSLPAGMAATLESIMSDRQNRSTVVT